MCFFIFMKRKKQKKKGKKCLLPLPPTPSMTFAYLERNRVHDVMYVTFPHLQLFIACINFDNLKITEICWLLQSKFLSTFPLTYVISKILCSKFMIDSKHYFIRFPAIGLSFSNTPDTRKWTKSIYILAIIDKLELICQIFLPRVKIMCTICQ